MGGLGVQQPKERTSVIDPEAKIESIIERRGAEFSRRDYRKIQGILLDMPSDLVHAVEASTRDTLWLIIAATDYVGDMMVEELD